MSDNKLISVIVPVYNVEEYLNQCIESILNQTYPHLEIILVNDGSTDTSLEICQTYSRTDSRVHVLSQNNQGVVAARQKGIDHAHGTFLSFVDADDWIEPHMYQELITHIKDYDLITSGYFRSYPNIATESLHFDGIKEGTFSTTDDMTYILSNMIYLNGTETVGICFSIWNKLFKKSIVDSFYKLQNSELKLGEDSVFLYKYILNASSVVVLHKSYYHYRVRLGSVTQSVCKIFLRNMNDFYLELESLFSSHSLNTILLSQLEKRVTLAVLKGLSYRMGFSNNNRPQYLPQNYTQLENKRIVLYGAGRVGKDYYEQLPLKTNCIITIWVDRNYELYQRDNYPVFSPFEINNTNFDYILLAVQNENLANAIKQELIDSGFDKQLILWASPQFI